MQSIYYIGLDIHKKIIAFCIKDQMGNLVSQGMIDANREDGVGDFNGLDSHSSTSQ
ncbi:MAG: hypothetical protein K0A93_09200 [Desulfuromonadaceae bacterium]|nr:hypothetical protein [Desulfuromonadaceae bacterium]